MPNTPLLALLGPAGTGKTYKIQQKLKKSPNWGKLCATTGIAAINLGAAGGTDGVMTLHSTLGYFDLESLRENFQRGKLRRVLSTLANEYKYLVIDEISMMDAETLDILVDCLDTVNANISEDHGEHVLGLILVGDFLQLPPVEGSYCFEAKNWKRFTVEKLEKIYRQTEPEFLTLLQAARIGDGQTVAKILQAQGCITPVMSQAPDITTIYAVNKDVDEWNDRQFRKLCATGAAKGSVASMRWGMQRKEWKSIPEALALAIGAYVMILANDTQEWAYANGDCGTVVGFQLGSNGEVAAVKVQLKRTGRIVTVPRIYRRCTQLETPPGFTVPDCLSKTQFIKREEELGVESDDWKALYESYLGTMTMRGKLARLRSTDPYYDFLDEKWVMGEIMYCPLRLAYASTCHKSQGLTLDNVQIVTNNKFFGKPNMMYVALSRARTLAGLKVVGTMAEVVKLTNTVKKLERWF